MYALVRTNPLINTNIESAYLTALEEDGASFSSSSPPSPSPLTLMIASILFQNVENNQMPIQDLANKISLFFISGQNYTLSILNNSSIQNAREIWHEAGESIIDFVQQYAKFPSNVFTLRTILNQIVSESDANGANYAANQVLQYFQHTLTGYQNGLNDNSGAIQFAIAFGIYLAKTMGL